MKTNPTINNMRGFTLVELMVVVLLTAIAVIAIYRGYTAFSHSADAQEQMIEMQQNLRIGMYWLEKDLRRAGMTEEDNHVIKVGANKNKVNEVTFFTADASTVRFGMDLGSGGVYATDKEDNDGDTVKDAGTEAELAALKISDPIAYEIAKREAEEESIIGDDDFNDEGEIVEYSVDTGNLKRNDVNAVVSQTIISNVDALNFVYINKDGEVVTPPEPIRSVEVSIVVHTTNEDYRYTDNADYKNLQDEVIFDAKTEATGDKKHLRRRLLSKRIKIRNAGL